MVTRAVGSAKVRQHDAEKRSASGLYVTEPETRSAIILTFRALDFDILENRTRRNTKAR